MIQIVFLSIPERRSNLHIQGLATNGSTLGGYLYLSCWGHQNRMLAPVTSQLKCYVRAERSARLELKGYDQVVWLIVNEAGVSGTR